MLSITPSLQLCKYLLDGPLQYINFNIMTDIPDKSVSVETRANMQWTYLDPELGRMDHPKKFQDGDSYAMLEIKFYLKQMQ